MLKVQVTGAKEMLEDLRTFRKKAVPYAARDTVNSAAFETRRIWSDEIRRTMTTRNQFVANTALRVDKATLGKIETIQSKVGTIFEDMPRQEFGATVSGRSGHKGIPGPAAAGQAPGGRRFRPVRGANRLSAIRAFHDAKGATRQQRNAVAIAMAKRRGMKHVVLERPKGGKGVFAIGGGKRKTTTRLVWDVSRKSVRIEPHPTLGPALKRIEPQMPRLMEASLLKQLRFHKCCGY